MPHLQLDIKLGIKNPVVTLMALSKSPLHKGLDNRDNRDNKSPFIGRKN
jgi:hypothetical protein